MSSVRSTIKAQPHAMVAVLIPALFSTLFMVVQLAQPHALTGSMGYDEGVYMASALRLSRGQLPYLDFDMVHPPGIAILLLPVAVLEPLLGGGGAFAVGRIVIAGVSVTNVALVAWVLRRHGALAMLIGGLLVAVHPLAVAATHTTTLEPLLVLFLLGGLATLFDANGEIADRRRVAIAGCLFGIAALVKIWAAFVVIPAVLVCLASRDRRRAASTLVGATVVGFMLPALTFIVAAPARFVEQIIGAQLGRTGEGAWSLSLAERLALVLGIGDFRATDATSTAIITGTLALTTASSIFVAMRREVRPIDMTIAGGAAFIAVSMALAANFYPYYTYLPVVVLSLLVGVCVGLLRAPVTRVVSLNGTVSSLQMARLSVASLMVVCFAAALHIPRVIERIEGYLSNGRDSSSMIASVIPNGSCVAFDEPGPLIIADRFVAARSCRPVVDPYSGFLLRNDGRPDATQEPFDPVFVAEWRSWMESAEYVLLAAPRSSFVPWTEDLAIWFDSNFELANSDGRAYVYRRR